MSIFGDGISVRVSARTRDFQRGLENAQDSLRDFSGSAVGALAPLQALQGRADEAGDEIAQAGRKASVASGQMTGLAGSVEIANVSMMGLSATTIGSLVPALVTLSSTLVPILAALGGFVAVAGAIGGIGLVGTLGAIDAETQMLKDTAMSLIATIRQEFGPTFRYMALVISELIGMVEEIVPALVPPQDVVREIGAQFLRLGAIIIESLPAFVDLATTLAQEFLPPFNRWLEDILPQVPGMIMAMVEALRRMLPRFMEAGRLLRDLLPPLMEFGFTALSVVGPALADLARVATSLLQDFNSLDGEMRRLIATGSLLLPVVTTIAGVIGGLSVPVLAAVGAIGLLAKAYTDNIGGIQETVNTLAGQLRDVFGDRLPALLDAFRQFWGKWGDEIMTVANVVIKVLGTGLVGAVDFVMSSLEAFFLALSGDWKGAVEAFIGPFRRMASRIVELVNDLTGGALVDLVNSLLGTINDIGSIIQKGADKLGVDLDIPEFEPVSLTPATQGPAMMPSDRRLQQAAQQQQQSGGPTQVNVRVEGDTGVIREVSTEVVQDESRRARRTSGRSAGPTR